MIGSAPKIPTTPFPTSFASCYHVARTWQPRQSTQLGPRPGIIDGICYSFGGESWKRSRPNPNTIVITIRASFVAVLIHVGMFVVVSRNPPCVMTVSKAKKMQQRNRGRKRSTRPLKTKAKTLLSIEPEKMETVATNQPTNRKVSKSRDDLPYVGPRDISTSTLGKLIYGIRSISENQQERMGFRGEGSGPRVWLAGDVSLLRSPCVSVVGAREVSKEGAARSRRLAKQLAEVGIVTVSGLAKGVDTEALTEAINAGGRVIAVIGTPVDRAYPAENKRLQERIYRDHLLVSQFAPGKRVFPSNFPERNHLMAAISDATVIVEASDTSGSLHQAAECSRLGRWLFIAKSLADNPALSWPQKFLAYPTTRVLTQLSDITDALHVN